MREILKISKILATSNFLRQSYLESTFTPFSGWYPVTSLLLPTSNVTCPDDALGTRGNAIRAWKPLSILSFLLGCFSLDTKNMPSRRKSGKNAPILSHEFVITNHGDIVSCICMVFMIGLMFQVK